MDHYESLSDDTGSTWSSNTVYIVLGLILFIILAVWAWKHFCGDKKKDDQKKVANKDITESSEDASSIQISDSEQTSSEEEPPPVIGW